MLLGLSCCFNLNKVYLPTYHVPAYNPGFLIKCYVLSNRCHVIFCYKKEGPPTCSSQDQDFIRATDEGERHLRHQIQLGGNPPSPQRGQFTFRARRATPPSPRAGRHAPTTTGRRIYSRSTSGRRTRPRPTKSA